MQVSTNFGTVKIVMLKGEQGSQGIQGETGPQGIQGEPFEFDDFTEEQLAELRSDVATVYCKKLEATYNTIGDSTTTIEIPFENYMTNDMLFVDVEGLALTEGTDYTISNGSIVLTTPITHHYTAVNFRLLRFIAMSTEDFDNLTGDIDAKIETDVDAWLTAHPESTTTVQPNTVTDNMLVQSGGVLGSVADIKSASVDGFSPLPYEFVNGGLSTSGAVTAEYHRIVTKDIIEATSDLYLQIADGYRLWYTEYNADGTFYGSPNWWYTGQWFIAKGKRFRIVIARASADEVAGTVPIALLSGKVVALNAESYDTIGLFSKFYSEALDKYLRMRFCKGLYTSGKFIPQGYAAIAKPFKFYKDVVITNSNPDGYHFNVKKWTTDEPIAANYITTSGWVQNSYTVAKDTWFTVEVASRGGDHPTPAQGAALISFSFDADIFELDVDATNELLEAESDTDTLAEKVKKILAHNMSHRYFNGSTIVSAPMYYSMVSVRTLPFDIQVDFSGKQFKVATYDGDNEDQLRMISNWGTTPVWIPANSYFTVSAQDTSAAHTLDEWYGYFNVTVEKDVSRQNDFIVPDKAYGSYYNVPSRFNLMWFSDIHASAENLKRVMQYANKHSQDLNDIICTGDMVFDQYTDSYDFWHAGGADNVLVVAGNHEGYKGSNGWATQQELYEKFFSPYIANWGVTYNAGYTNWYKVYNSKVMLIGLAPYTNDTTDSNNLVTFLTNALNLANTNGYAVVIAHHYPVNPAITTDVNTPFNTPNRTPRDLFIQDSVISAVNTFVQGGGEFVCYITGHTHYDRTVKITESNQLVLTIGTAATPQGLQSNSQFRSFTDTKYYDLFNILHVDTVAKIVSIKRIGADRDMWFRKLDYLAINYETGEML